MTDNRLTQRAGRDFNADVRRRLDRLERRTPSGVWRDYNAALTAAVTNPNIGSTGVALGRYTRSYDTVTAWGSVTFGGAGISAGSGNYQISVPFPRTAEYVGTNLINGTVSVFNGAGTRGYFPGAIMSASTSYFLIGYPAAWPTGANTIVGAAIPWAWTTATAQIAWFVEYEAAPY